MTTGSAKKIADSTRHPRPASMARKVVAKSAVARSAVAKSAVANKPVSENALSEGSEAKRTTVEKAVDENATSETESAVAKKAVSENAMSESAVAGNMVSENAASESAVAKKAVSENAMFESAVAGNMVPENAVSESIEAKRAVAEKAMSESAEANRTVTENAKSERAVPESAAINSAETRRSRAENSRAWRLDIIHGLHQGASIALPEDELLVVGSGANCDLQLFDEGIEARHLALMKRQNRVVVKSLEGRVRMNGGEVESGSQLDVVAANEITLLPGNVILEIHCERGNAIGEITKLEDPAKRTSKTAFSFWLDSAIAVALFLIIAALLVIDSGYSESDLGGEVLEQRVTDILEQLDIAEDLNLSESREGLVLHGLLDAAQLESLREELAQNNILVVMQIKTVERLLEQVRDVFRINGYSARLKYIGNAGVEVQNLDGENPKIKQVAEYVRQDVPELAALNFSLYSPPPAEDATGTPNPIDPGKRLTAIVDGDTAYLATEDGGRYFVGSLLPGGYAVRRITADGVQVDRDGEITWLHF